MGLVHAFLFSLPEDRVVRANGRKHPLNFTTSHEHYIICFTTFSGLGCSCCPGALAQGSSLKPQPCSPAADFHPLTVPALCQDTHIHPFPNLSPRARLQKIHHPCLWIEPGSPGCLFALQSNTKATTASESPGAWPGGHNHSSVTS